MMIKYIFINLSRLLLKEPSQPFSFTGKKSTAKSSPKIQMPRSLNWLRSLVKCGKILMQPIRQDWKQDTKRTRKKSLCKKLPMSTNTARSRRRKRKNTIRKIDIDSFMHSIYLLLAFFSTRFFTPWS